MNLDFLSFTETGYFSKLICDYIDQKKELETSYHRFPTLENFKAQIDEKGKHFQTAHRNILHETLKKQYANTELSKNTKANLTLLKETNTFTVTTGHQLNLFTGPLYFLYKIISTINLAADLKKKYPKNNVVPIYWMATEDHDFEEINYFNFKGKKIRWNRKSSGAVGNLKTKGLEELFNIFAAEVGNSLNAKKLKKLFEDAYLKNNTLTDATRFIANALFGEYGLVIIDADDRDLKQVLIPFIKKDIFNQEAFKQVNKSIEELQAISEDYKIQVNPREINYFYHHEGIRSRIIQKNDNYGVVDLKEKLWTQEDLAKEIEAFPERFSPNVIARPLYQEVILPNLCYIGGGGEIAYWLELKGMFEAMQVPFPMLLLRNSALVISAKQEQKLQKMQLNIADLFLKQTSLINKKIRSISNIDIDFSPQKAQLEEQFKALYEIAKQTDKSFLGAVAAQEKKQKKGLVHLEKRLLKAQKNKLKDQVVRLTALQNELFPNKSLQERNENFSELYLEHGDELIPFLIKALKPLQSEFNIITL